ncbi:MAG: type IV pilus assembly protein PilM [Planctomycetota bacterium]
MAGAVWGIDIGKAALKAVKLRATKEGLEIKAVEHIDYEGSGGDGDKRQEQVRGALTALLAKHKLRADRVLVALPGIDALSRPIKLPPVDAKKIDMMVKMEAQQQIPFPLSEVNWDYQKIQRDYEPGEEIEVGIFASKRDRITGFLNELKSHGIEPGVVTLAPLAVYNFITYNSDVGDEATVVLDIGSDHTDLVVTSGPRFWIRNLRIAGNDITKALADRFKVSFEEAEKLKRNASKSDQSKKIFSSMEPTLKDLVGEVHRSVNFFKSQAPSGELKIGKLILLGDGAKLKNLPGFFEKELGYGVEKVQKLEQDKFVLDPDVDVEMLKKHLLGFGVALGLAIQGADKAKCAINLAPDDIKVNEELKRKVPFAAGAAACAWLAFGLSYVTWTGWKQQLEATVKDANALNKFKDFRSAAQEEKEKGERLTKRAEPLKGLVSNRLLPLDVIRELKKVLPTANGKIPKLSPQDEALPLENQRAKIVELRKQTQADNKLWVLQLDVEKKVPPSGAVDPNVKPIPEGVYTVSLKLARALPTGMLPENVRREIKDQFVVPLANALRDGPFYLKSPGKDAADAWYKSPTGTNPSVLEDILTPGVTLQQLDPSTTGVYKETFQVLSCDLKFEVGYTPPAPAPAPPAAPGGEEKK